MELLLAGVSHKSGPLELRESLAALGASEALRRLKSGEWPEAVVLSTCNRFEVYAVGREPGDRERLAGLLEQWSGASLSAHAYSKSGAEAIRHLFAVASGLDSMVVGEAEILGQVKGAYEFARAAGATARLTNVLFQRALFVGKLVRSSTGISAGQLSVASVAASLAQRIFGSLKESSVLILGAGAMAELTAKHLLSGKVAKLRIANRTWEKGRELADALKAEAVRWEEFPRLLASVDIVVGSTGAARPVLTREMLAEALPARRGRSLFVIDIAMPRDVEASVDALDHVYLYTLADLEGVVRENLSLRERELEAARALVGRKAAEFEAWRVAAADGRPAALRHAAATVPDPLT